MIINYKNGYDPEIDQVSVLTIHSSKGLEFNRVILLGIDRLGCNPERKEEDARLLYVGMTRAQNHLLLTTSTDQGFSQELLSIQ